MLNRRDFCARAGGWLAWITTGCAGLASRKTWQTQPDLLVRHCGIDLGTPFVEFATKQPDGTFGPYRAIGICDDVMITEISLAQSSRPSDGFITRRENLPHQQAGLES